MKKIIISESEKNKILGKYKTPNVKSWYLKEAYSGTQGEGYNSVEECKKDTPYNVVVKAGLNWNQIKKDWGSKGTSAENIALKNAFCEGWRSGDDKTASTPSGSNTPGGSYIKGQLITPEFEKEKIGDGLNQQTLDNFKKFIPKYYEGSIYQIENEGKNYWIWENQDVEPNILYLEDGRIVKFSYDSQKDQTVLTTTGNWMTGEQNVVNNTVNNQNSKLTFESLLTDPTKLQNKTFVIDGDNIQNTITSSKKSSDGKFLYITAKRKKSDNTEESFTFAYCGNEYIHFQIPNQNCQSSDQFMSKDIKTNLNIQ